MFPWFDIKDYIGERKFYEREKQIIEIMSLGAFYVARLYVAFFDGANSHVRIHAVSHAFARFALRLHLRMAVGTDGRSDRTDPSRADVRRTRIFPECRLYVV